MTTCPHCGGELPRTREDRATVSVSEPFLDRLDEYARDNKMSRYDATNELVARALDVAEGKA